MIAQKSIQEVIESAKIEEVVGDFVGLKRAGVNMKGLCPFHNEKTPSFVVSPNKNIYKCFGCGEAGDPINFVMRLESMTYPEAIRYLAGKYNIELEETQSTQEHQEERKLIDSLYIINQFTQEHYQKNLFETDLGKSVGLSYFKERGYREETVKKFGLGFANAIRNDLTGKAQANGYNIDLLKKLGLTRDNGNDFFFNRVIFSIYNTSGKVVGFAGRILNKTAKAPKYINSPESDVYNKSKILYGLYHAKKAIRQMDECFMVEGYTDVISLNQSGLENVVASSGTSLTVEQIRLVKRFTPNLTILYDGDAAGIKAATRGLDLVLEQDMNVKVVLLPEGEDPDSYMKQVGLTKFREYISENASDFILFKTNLLIEETKKDPIKKAGLVRGILESIARIPDPIKRSVYIKECSSRLEMEENVLINELNKLVTQKVKKERIKRQVQERKAQGGDDPFAGISESDAPPLEGETATDKPTITDEFQEKDIIRILMQAGDYKLTSGITVTQFILMNIEDVVKEFDNSLYKKIIEECYALWKKSKVRGAKEFLKHTDNDVRQMAINVNSSPHQYSENWMDKMGPLRSQKMPDENFEADSLNGLMRFRLKKIVRSIEKKQAELKTASKTDQIILLKVLVKLNAVRNELAEKLKTVVLK